MPAQIFEVVLSLARSLIFIRREAYATFPKRIFACAVAAEYNKVGKELPAAQQRGWLAFFQLSGRLFPYNPKSYLGGRRRRNIIL